MFFGFGLTEVELVNGRVIDVYWARYADWLFTTPLLSLISASWPTQATATGVAHHHRRLHDRYRSRRDAMPVPRGRTSFGLSARSARLVVTSTTSSSLSARPRAMPAKSTVDVQRPRNIILVGGPSTPFDVTVGPRDSDSSACSRNPAVHPSGPDRELGSDSSCARRALVGGDSRPDAVRWSR